MKHLLLFLFGSFIATATATTTNNITTWRTGQYENNTNLTKVLNIKNAKRLQVTIKGKTEQGWDPINIYDKENKLIRRVSGNINTTFNVIGSSIIANLVSDDSNVDDGVIVLIKDISDKPYHDMTKWTTGKYNNNENNLIKLFSAGADKIKVSIQGSTEAKYDFIIIKDSQGKVVTKISGTINKNFIVDGSYITAQLISDDSTTDSGVTVNISPINITPIKEFVLNSYNPPRKTSYPHSSFDKEWKYYKGAHLESIPNLNPNNKPLYASAKKQGLKYYLDIRNLVFSVDNGSTDGLDSNGVDLLRGEHYCEDNGSNDSEYKHIQANYDDNDRCVHRSTGITYKVRNASVEDISAEKLAKVRAYVKKYKNDPNLLGYWIVDEPFPSVYKNLETLIKTIKKVDPNHPSIFNFGRNDWTDKKTMNQLVKMTDTKMISHNFSVFWQHREVNGTKYYGNYIESPQDNMTEEAQVRLYFERMKTVRDVALDDNHIEFMYIAQLSGEEHHNQEGTFWRTPNKYELRWEAYTAMAYGAHGISWFFWEYDVYDGSENEGWGLRDMPKERRDPMYHALSSVNKEIFELKDIMVTLTSKRVYHNDRSASSHRPVIAEDPAGKVLIGLFEKTQKQYANSEHYFMLVNKDYTAEITDNYYLNPTKKDYRDIQSNSDNISLEYFNIKTNIWERVELYNHKFTTSLDAGEGKLFRFSSN